MNLNLSVLWTVVVLLIGTPVLIALFVAALLTGVALTGGFLEGM